ncbi:LamG-like jellyroll fold domain-containing protein [Candidatus Solirubrobacter pratensis]|uniref:LamG-like jellyroll fold domain-containing protein n=1 Tax=Candidatus Solirubrobacter pratensis TaxID=1298857 RepID=UPI000685CA5E|nr:LamG-like jellyroll fold domain-containing protein [Candidatus Solirubrobacter pratensis]
MIGFAPIVAVLASAAPAAAANLPATPANFVQVFASATAGDVVVLGPGSYGRFTGAQKPGNVTVLAPPGVTASMSVDFQPASNITLDGLAITGLTIGNAASKNLTVRNSRFDGSQAVLRTGELSDANILFERNTHSGFVACSTCYEGRVELAGKTSRPAGVTIRDSFFSGGNSDGIQNGARGAQIIGNEFTGINQLDGASGVHADSIQLYGSSGTVVRGNYFHDVAVGIMAADGADHETVEDNVFAVTGSPYAITLLSDNGSVLRHNTLLDNGTCDYNQRCGILFLGNKAGDPASTGTILVDNILTQICLCDGTSRGLAQEDHNLLTNATGTGAGDLRGKPAFVGGARPATFAGFALAAGSLGKGSASDGTDRGARVTGTAGGSAPGGPGGSAGSGGSGASGTPGAGTGTPGAAQRQGNSLAPGAGGSASSFGLVAAYGFDERSGARVRDASGMGNDGRLRGAARVRPGRRGGRALAFDGRNDSMVVADASSLRLTTGMTLEAWVRPAGGARRWSPVIAKRSGRSSSFALYAGDGSGRLAALRLAGGKVVRAARRLAGGWTHLSTTYDGMWARLYVDGRLVRRVRSKPLEPGPGALTIGAAAGRHFKGRIDDVRIYSRALSAAELRSNMRQPVE